LWRAVSISSVAIISGSAEAISVLAGVETGMSGGVGVSREEILSSIGAGGAIAFSAERLSVT
jgi:hypothetical protein